MPSSNGGDIFGYGGSLFRPLRIGVFCLCFVAVIFALSPSVSALSFSEMSQALTRELGLASLENDLPQEARDGAEQLGVELSLSSAGDILDVSVLLKAMGKYLLGTLKEFAPFMGAVCGLSLFGFILRELCSPSENTARICETVSVFGCFSLAYGNLTFTLRSVSTVLDSLTGYINATLPVTLGLVSAAGRPGLASLSGTLVYTAVTLLGTVLSTAVPLFINGYFCLGTMAAVSENKAFSDISSALKKISVGVMTFLYFLFTAIGISGHLTTVTADTLAKKSVKYAAGTYIPVAGGYISEGIDLWFTCVEELRNTGGVFGIAVISLSVLLPLLGILGGYTAFSLAGGIFALGGNLSSERFISVVKDAYSVIFSLLCGYGIMLCVLYALMMKGI